MKARPGVASSTASLGAALTFAAMLHEGNPGELSWWSRMLGFGLWGLLPFLIVLVLSRRWTSFPAAQSLLAVAGSLVMLSAAYLLYEALFAKKHSTFGLAFLVMPIYQLVVVIPLSLAAWWAARRGERP